MKRSPINPINRARRAKLYARNFAGPDGGYDDWIRAQPCEVTGADPEMGWPIVAAHMTSRGAGGDYTDLVPLTSWVHTDYDELPEAKFLMKYGRTKASVREQAPLYLARYMEGA
jgi:hypothetical protein